MSPERSIGEKSEEPACDWLSAGQQVASSIGLKLYPSGDFCMRIRSEVGEADLPGSLATLLDEISRVGSIRAAAKALSRSYGSAFYEIRDAEEALGISLLESHSPREGSCLTPVARLILDAYRAGRDEAARAAAIELRKRSMV